MVITSILRPVFLTGSNLMQILVNNNSIFLTGFGMTFVILAGGIDLSQGSACGVFHDDGGAVHQHGNPL